MRAGESRKQDWRSVHVALAAVLFFAVTFGCAIYGLAPAIVDFHFVVYSALFAGVLALVGAGTALRALLHRDTRSLAAYCGLALNFVLLMAASCFTLLI